MSTPFTDIFDLFLSKITDSQMLSMSQTDLEDQMYNFLISSIPRFRTCKQSLDYDSVNRTFNVDLTIDEKEILSQWMLYNYLDQNIFRIELLKQSLSSKDYALYSQAQHIKELLDLRKNIYDDVNQMIIDYGYYFGEVGDLK